MTAERQHQSYPIVDVPKTELVDEISFPDLAKAYTKSCEFKGLRPVTQTLYKNSLQAIARRIQNSGTAYSEISTSMFTDSFESEKVSNYTKSAFNNALLWGNHKGLTSADMPPNRNARYSQPALNFSPLTPNQLDSLVDIAAPKYKALILLTVTTRARPKSVLGLSKDNFQRGPDNQVTVEIEGKKITIPERFEPAIMEHVDNTPRELLFESTKEEWLPMIQPTAYGKYKTYAKRVPGIAHLSHSDLVATGEKLLGRNS